MRTKNQRLGNDESKLRVREQLVAFQQTLVMAFVRTIAVAETSCYFVLKVACGPFRGRA